MAAGAVALMVLFLYPMGRKMAEEELKRVGLTNHDGEAPRLLCKRRDPERSHVTVWVFDNRGISIQEWRDKQSRIETALDITIANIKHEKGKRRILLYAVPAKGDLPDFITWKDKYLSPDEFVLTLGESIMEPVTVDLANTPHVLLGGSTGSGKSVLLKLLLMQSLHKGATVYISDFKGGVDFPKVWHERCQMCFDEEALLELLTTLVNELERRKTLFAEQGYPNIAAYNKGTGEHLKRLIFACDEVAEVLDKTGMDKAQKGRVGQIESKLATIARLGRAFGIHLILATQRPDAQLIPGQIRNNLDCRICGRAERVLSELVLDSPAAAEQIPKDARGRFLLYDGTVFQSYWLDEGNI
jgi:DNA segregation ATPase ftsK/spoIIIE and related proteins